MADSVIDALVVELKLDPKEFSEGLKDALNNLAQGKDAAKKTAGGIEDSAKSLGSVITQTRSRFLEFFAVLVGTKSVLQFADEIRESNTHLGRLSLTLGENAQELSAWGTAATAAGGSAEDAYGSFQTITRAFQQLRLTGQGGDQMLAWARMGIHLQDANGDMHDLNDAFLKAAAWGETQRDKAFVATTFANAGITEGMIPLLLQGQENLKHMLALGKKYGPTQADIDAAKELTAQYGLLDAAVHKVGRDSLTELIPNLSAFWTAIRRRLDGQEPGGENYVPTPEDIAHDAAIYKALGKPFNALAPIWSLLKNADASIGIDDTAAAKKLQSWFGSSVSAPVADKNLPSIAQALLRGIGSAEGADYNTLYGGGTFTGNQFPQWAGKTGPTGKPTHAAGRYQFEPATWAMAAKALGLKDFSPESQDKAALWLAQRTYKGDLLGDLSSGDPTALAHIAAVLSSQWEGLKIHPGALQAQLGAKGTALTSGALDKDPLRIANTDTRETNIGVINVNAPQAKDAKGIARGISSALDDSLGMHAQGGMQ